jgi:hypothetical protein
MFKYAQIISAEEAKALPAGHAVVKLVFVDDEGNPTDIESGGSAYVLPAATTSALGGVKKASGVTAVSSANATAAAGEAPTKAEFDAVVTLCNELKAQLNDLISKSKTAGQMA